MENIEFVKGMKILQGSYSKDFTEDELKIWFIQFQDIKSNIFYKAINNIIRKSKYMPSIAELLEECENVKEKNKFEIIEYMKEQNYFKDETEYNKAISWLEKGIIPNWLKEDMKNYNKLYINQKQLKLES